MNQQKQIGNWQLYEELSVADGMYEYLVQYTGTDNSLKLKKWKIIFASYPKNQKFDQDSPVNNILILEQNYQMLQNKHFTGLPSKPKGPEGHGQIQDGNDIIVFFVIEELDYTLENYFKNFGYVGVYDPIDMIYLIASYLLDTISNIAHTKNIIANISPKSFMIKHYEDKIFLTNFELVFKYVQFENYEHYFKDEIYTSASTDINNKITPKDNIESIMYVIVSLITTLPWENDISIKQTENMENFMDTKGCKEIGTIINICKTTNSDIFDQNYNDYIKNFQDLLSIKYKKYLQRTKKENNIQNSLASTPKKTPHLNPVKSAVNDAKNAENQRIQNYGKGLRPVGKK